ncbi:MAG: zinc-dependent metalloprotease [Actinomycetota bacterium]|nr:zinc-dependent metalloprotease [Actinomycetota bacterium]
MIDWRLATVVAQGVAGLGPTVPAGAAAPFEALAAPAEESRRLVEAYTGLVPVAPVPRAEGIDRGVWIDTSLGGMRGLLDPVIERLGGNLGALAGPVRAAAGALLAAEVGVLSGVLAQRVLGQYEFPVLDPQAPARLLFVAPNLAHAARSLGADPEDLKRWVALHEMTHALQFGGVPWLREHLAGRVGGLLAALEVEVDPRRLSRLPSAEDLRGLVEAVRRGELATLVMGDAQRAQLEEMQAFMAVLEGYAEHVMDAVGADLLPRLPELRAAMDRRRRDRTGLLRLFERLIGLDMKLRQYELGKSFCDAVVARGGIAALNRVWEVPERMPSPAELEDPPAWLARTEPPRLQAAGP